MPVARKRKLAVGASGPERLLPTQKAILSFGTISKGAAAKGKHGLLGKEKLTTSSISVDLRAAPSPSKRRKVESDREELDDAGTSATPLHPPIEEPQLPKATPLQSRTNSLKRSLLSQDASALPLETPREAARGRLAQSRLQSSSSPSTPIALSSPSPAPNDSPPSSPCSEGANSRLDQLPQALQEFVDLHAALLTALSLHYAHHGTSIPVDVGPLMKSTERIWGKRKVNVKDIQRLVGLMAKFEEGEVNCGFKLMDFGHGKVVLENSITVKRSNFSSRPFDEDRMRGGFESILRALWAERGGGSENEDAPVMFVKGLTSAPIDTCPVATSSSSKGQRRLEELRGFTINAQEQKSAVLNRKECTGTTVKSRGSSLLERIKAKELHQSQLPPPLSKEASLRRAALQRVEDIAGILSMLKTSAPAKNGNRIDHEPQRQSVPKASFSLPSLVQRIKDSSKNPVAREEVELCLKLLDKELAVDWVHSMNIGKLQCVILEYQNQPTMEALRARVQMAQREG